MPIMSEDIKEIAKALGEVQGKLKNVPKENNGYNYRYADLGQCLNVIREPLKDHGLAITQVMETQEGGPALITVLMHTSGQWIKSCFPLNVASISMANKMQAFGAIISYARRYSLAGIVGLAQEDDDAQEAIKEESKTPLKPPSPILKATPKPQEKKSEPVINQLRTLCQTQGIDLKEFGKYFKLDSTDLEKISKVVTNFHDYYRLYNEREINHA